MVRGQARDLGEPPPATLRGAGGPARARRPPRCSRRRWRSARWPPARRPTSGRRALARYGERLRHRLPARRRPRRRRARRARRRGPARRLQALIDEACAARRAVSARAASRLRRICARAPAALTPAAVAATAAPSAVIPSIRWMAPDESTQIFERRRRPTGGQAGPRLPGRPGRRQRRRDVQDRGRQDRHRPRPEGADSAARRRHLARARAGRARGRPRSSCEDLGSTNGTFCNGLKVDRKELADGDKILVGSTTILKFTYHDNLDEIFQKQMYESALRDGLTKVFNKKYFTDRLESEFTFAIRHVDAAGAGAVRHRSLQEGERHLRPPGRRLRAVGAVDAADRRAARRGRLRPLRRRGVRGHLPRHRRRRRRQIVAERMRKAVESAPASPSRARTSR